MKGDGQEVPDKEPSGHTDIIDVDLDEYEEDEPLQISISLPSEGTAASQTGTKEDEDEDEPIQMRIGRAPDKGASQTGAKKNWDCEEKPCYVPSTKPGPDLACKRARFSEGLQRTQC